MHVNRGDPIDYDYPLQDYEFSEDPGGPGETGSDLN